MVSIFNNERFVVSKEDPVERMKKKMRARLELAKKNPISRARLDELEEKEKAIVGRIVERGFQDIRKEIMAEDEIFEELKRSSAMAYNLPEFRLLLEEHFSHYSPEARKSTIDHLLAHENAHVNVAKATGHTIKGYALLFVKRPSLYPKAIPMCLIDPDTSWEAREILEKALLVIDAPRVYGDKLSEQDEQDMIETQDLLAKLDRNKAKRP